MLAQLRRSCVLLVFGLFTACLSWAQTATLQGEVKGPDGQPLKGAQIVLDRTDIKGQYKVKSDKRGHWLYTGLPLGTYNISCLVDDKVVDSVKGVKGGFGEDNPPVNFDLAKTAAAQAAMAKASDSGELSKDQERGMSKADREKFEAASKQRSEAMKKNKALNDAFNVGMDALKKGQGDTDQAQKVTDFRASADGFTKATELDAGQTVIWDNLGLAYFSLGNVQTGDDKAKSYDSAINAYQKELTLKPDSGSAYNQIGNIYGAQGKMPEATEALTKAAQLDPATAPKAYFNMGANLVNHGKADEAVDFFKKATTADPNYAEAWYQEGSLLMAKGSVDSKTGAQTYPPDTAVALKKYLELQPTGTHAAEATAMLQAMGETVQTKVGTFNTTKKKK